MKETNERKLLRMLGEETIYSAKGHFKACDLRRQLVTYTIWGCASLNIFGIITDDTFTNKILSAIGLLGTMALLIWNEGEGKNYRARHKETGEKYLALHKEIRNCHYLTDCNKEEVEHLSRTVIQIDQSEKHEIPGLARWLAKRAIEKKDPETDNWFLKEK